MIPIVFTAGGVNILSPYYGDVDLNKKVQAYDAAMILKYVVGAIDLNKIQLANANVSLDTTVSAYDATLILQYGVGLLDSLPFTGSTESCLADGDIAMQNSSVQENDILEIPIILNNGNNILSFEGNIIFNPEHLSFQDIVWSKLTDNFMTDINFENGNIQIAGASVKPKDEAEGVFATLQFTVNNNFTETETAVTIEKFRWNEGEYMKNISVIVYPNTATGNIENNSIPMEYSLSRNYPNPFNPTTTINYSLKETQPVQILIYNQMGNLVNTLVNTVKTMGNHSVIWSGKNEQGEKVASGIYFYSLKVGSNILFTQKMIMIK
jgi:hypothetical protein